MLPVSLDGERTMTRPVSGVATMFQHATTNPIIPVWCGLYQVELVIRDEYLKLCEDNFVSVLDALVVVH